MPQRRGHGVALLVALALATIAAVGPGRAAPAVAASCNGASHAAPTLSSGRASPGSGSPTTTIAFSVRYADAAGCAPSSVEVVISGLGRYRMRASASTYASGVTFRFARRLPAGRWSYRFVATSGSGSGQRSTSLSAVSPTRVVIKKPAAASSPKPTPRPTAKPRSGTKATPRPVVTARPAPGSTSVDPSASPDGAAVIASPGSGSDPGDGGRGNAGRGSDGDGTGGGGGRDHARLSASTDFGVGIDPAVTVPVAAWSITTAFGIVVFALGLLPVRRRRDPEGRRWRFPILRAIPETYPATPRTPVEPIRTAGSSGEIARQPWLLGARDTAPPPGAIGPGVREPLRFHAPPRAGIERRAIAYRSVRVADQPDGTTSSEICRLDRGDEIEIIGEHEGFLKVRIPTGVEGWVQRMVIVG